MDKYLFLDIDGVLNSEDFYIDCYKSEKDPKYASDRICTDTEIHPDYTGNIDQTAVRMIRKIVSETGCKVVLSSSWRSDSIAPDELKKMGIEICGTTPYDYERFRGREIQKFLESHPCETYCILDDDSDMLDEHRSNFVQTNPSHGLTDDDTEKVIGILGNTL